MKKLDIKMQQKQDTYHKLLEREEVKEEMHDVYQYEFQQLRQFYMSIDSELLESLSFSYNLSFDPIVQTLDILKKIKLGLKSGEQSLKQNIRNLLINLLFVKQPAPAIFIFLKVSQNTIEIIYRQELQGILTNLLSKIQIEVQSIQYQQFYDQLIDVSDQVLILESLILINDQFDKQSFLSKLSSKQFEVFDQVFSVIKRMDFSDAPQIIQQIVFQINQFNEKLQKRKYDLESVRSEKFPQFVLKIILMLLRQKEIVIPELLLYIYFKKSESKVCLAIRAAVKELSKMFQIAKMKDVLDILLLDESIFSRGIQGYEQMYKKCQQEYPHFLKMKLNGALIQYVEYLELVSLGYREQLKIIYQNPDFNDLLSEIWKLCGKGIQLILQKMVNEEIEYAKFGSNVLRIGTFLYRIKFKLEKKMAQSNPDRPQDKNPIPEEPSQEKRYVGVTEKNMNPLFKTFVTKLVQKKKPYPFLLKTLKMDLYNLKVGYRITEMREIVCDPKFKKFMYKTHGVTWDKEDPDENLDYIITRLYPQAMGPNGKKFELNWPRLIKKQVKLIYAERENLKVQLLDAYQNPNFQRVYAELIKLNDNNKKKMQTKELLIMLVDYIVSIQ